MVHYYETGKNELYNLKEDIHERHDLSQEAGYGKLVREMASKLSDHLRHYHANMPYFKANGDKEKYADLSRIADLIAEAHNELAPYKFGKLEPEQSEGFDGAAQKVSEAIAVLETVIKRDGEIKKLNG